METFPPTPRPLPSRRISRRRNDFTPACAGITYMCIPPCTCISMSCQVRSMLCDCDTCTTLRTTDSATQSNMPPLPVHALLNFRVNSPPVPPAGASGRAVRLSPSITESWWRRTGALLNSTTRECQVRSFTRPLLFQHYGTCTWWHCFRIFKAGERGEDCMFGFD